MVGRNSNISAPQRDEKDDPHEVDRSPPMYFWLLSIFVVFWGVCYLYIFLQESHINEWNDKDTADWVSIRGSKQLDSEGLLKVSSGERFAKQSAHSRERQSLEKGKHLYLRHCSQCHQLEGQGIAGVFPPLAKSEWLGKNDEIIIAVILKGLQGPIIVDGQMYNGIMPAHERLLNDHQIVDLIYYIRYNWSEGGDLLDYRQIGQVRDNWSAWGALQEKDLRKLSSNGL